jgi:hypothetical protein
MQGFAILALVSLAQVSALQESVTPVQKVVEMMNDMLAKGKKEKQDETVRFTTFKSFCENTEKSKTKAIKKGGEDIETLTANIEKADADALELGTEVKELDAFIGQSSADLEAATTEREAENAEYEKAHSEYVAAVAAVQRAIEMVKSGIGARAKEFAQVSALLQIHTSILPDAQREALENWLSNPKAHRESSLMQDAVEYGYELPAAPEAHAYEHSSGPVLDMLEKLGDKFQDETDALERAETNARANYGMLATDLKHTIATSTDKRTKKATRKSERKADSASMTSDKEDTAASKAADEKYLKDLIVECEQKSFDYSARQKVRQGEIEAIDKAIEIMTSDDLSGGSAHLPGLIQKSTSLAQLRSSNKGDNVNRVVTFLMRKAGDMNSKMLMLLAQHAQNDPFKKVKKMIKDMIFKLQEEANEEAEHKGFCDTELSTNKQTRDTKSDQMESLKADIEEYTADIAKLADDISKLQAEITEIDEAVAKATMERRVEKAKNMATIADSEAAEEATSRALALLKEFYEKAAVPIEQPAPQQGPIKWDDRSLAILKTSSGGASLLQVKSVHKQPTPEMEEGQYSGMGNGGVLGLLEVIQSDFARVISETRTSEADSQHEFDQFSADSSEDKAVKEADVKHKENVKVQKASALGQAQKDLRVTDQELTAAMDYFEKLKPSCIDNKETYAERVARRNEEIQSLKEAVEILEGSSTA